jgi:type I restriction enzyme S subunit
MPDGWRDCTLSDVVGLQRGFDLPTSKRRPGSVPILGSFGVTGWHDVASVNGPGVTIGRSGASIGIASYTDTDYWPLNTTLFARNFHENEPRFVYYLLKSINFTAYNSGSAQPSLNRNYIARIPVKLPPLLEQIAIAEVLGALDDTIENSRTIARRAAKLALAESQVILADPRGPVVSLPSVADITKGVSYRSEDLVDGGKYLVSLKCVGRNGAFQLHGLKPYRGEYRPEQVVEHGDVVIAQTDLTQRAEVIGRPVRVQSVGTKGQLVASLDLIVVRPQSFLTRETLFSLLSTQDFRDHALSYCNGTTVLHMGARCLPEYRFRLPTDDALESATAIMQPLFARADLAERERLVAAELRDVLLPRLLSGELRVREAEELVGRPCESVRR